MRIGHFECEKVKDEILQAYREDMVAFFRDASLRTDIGFIGLALPTENKFPGLAIIYNSSREVAHELNMQLVKILKKVPEYVDEQDSFLVMCFNSGRESYMNSDVLVCFDGNIFSGKQVSRWVE